MKKITIFKLNQFSRLLFLFLTPALFTLFNFAFIWHSIYYGSVTFVIVIWGIFVIITPLFGKIGCGWFCPFGTIQDLIGEGSIIKIKSGKPLNIVRYFCIFPFFISAFTFFFIRIKQGIINGFHLDLFRIPSEFDGENTYLWIYDTIGVLFITFLLGKRVLCRNICFLGGFTAIGSKYSRLLLVVDKDKCNNCGLCTTTCLGKVDIDFYINKNGLITDTECLKCGRCIESCDRNAITYKLIWNRKKYLKLFALQ